MINNNKTTILLPAIIVLVSIVGIFYFIQTKPTTTIQTTTVIASATPAATQILDQTITLSGTVKKLNPSTPAEYAYELILDKPFYDELQASGEPNMTKVPLLSRDDSIQESMKGYVEKEVTVEGSMEWGYGESRFLNVSSINLF